jgi:tetratricopeptide (TPR) repeat protein
MGKSHKEKKKKEEIQKKPLLNLSFFEKYFFKSKTFHLILFILIFSMAVLLRFLFLSADLTAVSWSQDLTTDGPQYTLFARTKILTGQLDPFGHYRFPLWVYSAYTFIGYIFFKLLGLGRFQANMISVTLNILTLFLFYFALKKALGWSKAILSTFFLSINFVLIVYSRNTFAEISTIFFLVLSLFFLTFGWEKKWLLPLAGASQALAIFFGKMLAMFILGASFLVFVLAVFASKAGESEKEAAPSKASKYLPLIFFASGFLLVFFTWYLAIYHPATKNIAGYLKEMSVGLYGSPEGLQSFKNFIYWLFTFGGVNQVFRSEPYLIGTEFFYKMPVVFFFAFIFILSFLKKLFSAKGSFLKKISPLELFLVLWLLLGILSLFPWNYRPLRYQVLLIVPLCGLAGFSLVDLIRTAKEKFGNIKVWFWVLFFPVCMFLIFHALSFLLKLKHSQVSLNSFLFISFFITVITGLLFYLWGKKQSFFIRKEWKIVFVAVMVIVSLMIQSNQLLSLAYPKYSLKDASLDLGQILGEGAVLSGPYAPALTLDNRISVVIHMFGVAYVDTALFLRYPITHLALEQGDNAIKAFKDYPEVMKNAPVLTTYVLRNLPVSIYRVAEWTKNPKSEKYQLSLFEKAKELLREKKLDSAAILFNRFIQEHPKSFSAYNSLSEIYLSKMESDTAVAKKKEYLSQASNYLAKAVELDRSNFLLYQKLGILYLNLANLEGSRTYWQKGIEEWEKSLKIMPQNTRLKEELERIKRL